MKSSKLFGTGRCALLAAVLASTLLASCGGGNQVQTFAASRVISFGDESSVINADGSKYTVNALVADSTTALDCASSPIWNQTVAAVYGLVFPQCAGTVVDPSSRIRATVGATVADVSGQIDAQLTDGGFVDGDLVTVFVGVNDVLAQFGRYTTDGSDASLAAMDAAGTALAGQVNRLASLGAKVLITTIPEMGRAPAAGDRTVGSTNANPAILSLMSQHFNDALLAGLTNDGHKIGLIQLDSFVNAVDNAVIAGASVTYTNTSLAACQTTAPAPTCTSNTLVPEAVGTVWLWADDRHLSAVGHSSLSSLAVTRAQNNPF
jgi:outer membrane lipase/esterase